MLDTVADIYAANESTRRIVRQFIGLLTGLAIELGCAIVLLAHPSKAGMASGDNYSGSTAWNGSVRSRLSLEYASKASGDADGPVDRNARVLKHAKSNRGARLDDMKLRWQGGVFVRTDTPTGLIDRALIAEKAERVFLALIDWHQTAGVNVSASRTANNSAPKTFTKHADSEGLSRSDFDAAMHRLLKDGRIVSQQYGRPSEPRYRLVRGTK